MNEYKTSRFVKVVGFRLDEFTPIATIIIEFDDGSEMVLSEHFFNRHGFKLRDKVIITINLDPDQTDGLIEQSIMEEKE